MSIYVPIGVAVLLAVSRLSDRLVFRFAGQWKSGNKVLFPATRSPWLLMGLCILMEIFVSAFCVWTASSNHGVISGVVLASISTIVAIVACLKSGAGVSLFALAYGSLIALDWPLVAIGTIAFAVTKPTSTSRLCLAIVCSSILLYIVTLFLLGRTISAGALGVSCWLSGYWASRGDYLGEQTS